MQANWILNWPDGHRAKMTSKTYIKQTSKVRRTVPDSLRPDTRLQRMHATPALRRLLAETAISVTDLVCPLLLCNNKSQQPDLPYLDFVSTANLHAEIEQLQELGIGAVFVRAVDHDIALNKVIGQIKRLAPAMLVIAELGCASFYKRQAGAKVGYHENDFAVINLCEQAVSLAQAGADILAPAEMHDGIAAGMRNVLDRSGCADILIMARGVRYNTTSTSNCAVASSSSAAAYRMDPANAKLAMRSIETVIKEDADIIMLDPAQNYLDIMQRAHHEFAEVPFAAMHGADAVAMISAAAERGWINQRAAVTEALLAIKRAGASFIITYFAKTMAKYLA
jgi:porphobilinogen synthase